MIFINLKNDLNHYQSETFFITKSQGFSLNYLKSKFQSKIVAQQIIKAEIQIKNNQRNQNSTKSHAVTGCYSKTENKIQNHSTGITLKRKVF